MTIHSCVEKIEKLWLRYPGASLEILRNIELSMGLLFPSDFIEFMQWSSGGEAKLPNVYLSLWNANDIVKLNDSYQIQKYLGKNVLGIGSDGGPICFLLDYRSLTTISFSSVNFGDLEPSEIKNLAPSFMEGLELAINGSIVNDEL